VAPRIPIPGHSRSFWLQQALLADPGHPCPPLDADVRADVCIVGGGYTGLWTALELKRRDPSTEVVVVEADICGGGASGRNGGFVLSWWDELPEMVERFGSEQALLLAQASTDAVGQVGEFCAEHGIDSYRQAGTITAATCEPQLGAWDAVVEACRAVGRPEMAVPISGEEARARTGCPLLLAGVVYPDAATVQPAFLVRVMREAALDAGVRIHEHTPLLELDRGWPARVSTPRGSVEADRVVLAQNAWLARWRELRRAIVPIASYIVLTEPAPERIAGSGWSGGESLGDARLLVHYTHVTADGRIAFGRGGGAIGPLGRVTRGMDHDARVAQTVADDFRRFFPALADLRITHAWGGPIDRAPHHLPFAGTLGAAEHVLYFGGYSGNGVGPTRLGGTLLASLVRGERDALSTSALVSGPPAYLPPEHVRTLGGVVIREAVRRREGAEELGEQPDRVSEALSRLVWFTMPEAVEPRLRGARPRSTAAAP
jgi:glycine/D-amino acid oxidase-like deaminating enzyme